jgi:NAD-reducing hydrogenase large subunit
MTDPSGSAAVRAGGEPVPKGLRRIAIDPVSRVEGHGRVTLLLDEHRRVRQARLHIVEFRGFERFIEGRPYWEVPVVVQRLCGICPVSHQLAACKALDQVAGAHVVTVSADRLRRLMHYGQVMQSHALHFFHLSAPDLLFGFEAEPERRNLVGLVEAHPEIARQGIALRRYGQEVIRATSGKRVHGTGAVPGGVNRHLDPADHAALRAEAPTMLDLAERAVELVAALHRANAALYDRFAPVRSPLVSLVAPDGVLELYDGAIRVRDADGRVLMDQVPTDGYRDLLVEEVRDWSYVKFPHLRALGPEAGWYRVGPLARVQNADRIATPRAEARRQEFLAHWRGAVVHASLASHWARMIEMLHAMEVVAALLDDPAVRAGERMAGDPARARRGADGQREGIGVIEAPRGTLVHHYRVGDDDLVTMCNLIVSTTHNNQAMNEAVRAVADAYFDGREVTEGLLNHVEVAIRAFDPCLSCATHALGRMPLEVTVLDGAGAVVDRVTKASDGTVRRTT